MKPRILVTGGTGYIGSHTVVELQNAGYPVVIIDDLSNSNRDVLDGIERISGIRPEFVEADCTDMNALRALFDKYTDIKGIINFAASKAVGESMQKPLLYYRNNLNTLMNLLDMMGEKDVKGIVFSSSCTVYGEPDVNPVTEQSPIKKATSPYGNTKEISEEIITDTINACAPFKSVILRYFNPVGAHPSAEIGELPNGVPQNLIPYLTQTAMGIRKELSVFGDDYYIELQRHKATVPRANHEVYEIQMRVNEELVRLARKYDIKLICTNDVHFVNEDDAEAHERLICVATNKKIADENRMLYSKQEWLKTTEEMRQVFADIPESLDNTMEILDKVEFYDIDHAPIMPFFAIPEEFGTEEEYRSRITEEELFNEFTRDENGNEVMSREEG